MRSLVKKDGKCDVLVSKDGGEQAEGSGKVINLGNGEYEYFPTPSETDSKEVSLVAVKEVLK